MENIRYLIQNWYYIPKGLFRLCFILLNNGYCIGTYVVWMLMLYPLRKCGYNDVYWRIEGQLFHWLLAMVSMWSWWAGYEIQEAGDDITVCLDERTLVIANHQSTGDVPLLMATFNPKKLILPNIMWIMDNLFKYTNFGIVSVIHQDFFIMSGKSRRDKSLQDLAHHIFQSYLPNKRKWMVLFPEGGFLRKRKAVSQRFARENNLPQLEYVTVPRVGALQVIMDCLTVKSSSNNNSMTDHSAIPKLEWILDITIAYPDGEPIDLGTIVFGHRPPCKTLVFYRLYPRDQVPEDSESLKEWLFDRWFEKEKMLETFYKTGQFPLGSSSNIPQLVGEDYLRFLVIHLFFIASTYFHIQMFTVAYQYCNYLIY